VARRGADGGGGGAAGPALGRLKTLR
jgi:hypothetical protein